MAHKNLKHRTKKKMTVTRTQVIAAQLNEYLAEVEGREPEPLVKKMAEAGRARGIDITPKKGESIKMPTEVKVIGVESKVESSDKLASLKGVLFSNEKVKSTDRQKQKVPAGHKH